MKGRDWVSDVVLGFKIKEEVKAKLGLSDDRVRLHLTYRQPDENEIALYRKVNCRLKNACEGRTNEHIAKERAKTDGLVSYICDFCPQFSKVRIVPY